MKLPKIGIHAAFLPIILIGFFTETLFRLLAVYLCLLIHEAGHIAAARSFGIKLSYLKIMPFGIAMRFKTPLNSHKTQFVTAVAGPLASIIAGLLFKDEFLRAANLALGIFNLLPVKTLDGGKIFFLAVSSRYGTIRAHNILKTSSLVISVLMLILGGYILYETRFNVSLVLVSVFLIYNLIQGSDYGRLSAHVTALDYRAKKLDGGIGGAAYITVSQDVPLRRILTRLPSKQMCFINIIDSDGHLVSTISEKTAVDIMLKYGAHASYKHKEKYDECR